MSVLQGFARCNILLPCFQDKEAAAHLTGSLMPTMAIAIRSLSTQCLAQTDCSATLLLNVLRLHNPDPPQQHNTEALSQETKAQAFEKHRCCTHLTGSLMPTMAIAIRSLSTRSESSKKSAALLGSCA